MANSSTKMRYQNRPRNRGSLLILVVVLLVLVFLMGTAYMVTTRSDRYSAEQFRANSQNGLAAEAVQNAVVAQIVNDQPFYAAGQTPPRIVPMWDCATNNTNTDDLYLAERYPEWQTAVGAYWSSISWPLWNPGGVRQFVDPRGGASFTFLAGDLKNTYRFLPTFMTIGGTSYPAMTVYNAAFGPALGTYPAADADGDGVADSMLFQVPQVGGDGLTYYAAIRVVDNCAAINANTAWSSVWDFSGTGAAVAPYDGLFPTGAGLLEMLANLDPSALNSTIPTFTLDNLTTVATVTGQHESRNLYNARVGLQLNDSTAPNAPPEHIWGIAGGAHGPERDDGVESNGAGTTVNYRFVSMGDAFSSQLARRPLNPGLAIDTRRFAAFSEADTLSLAQSFCIVSTQASPSQLEQTLPLSLRGTLVLTAPYPLTAAGITQWFNDNFNWGLTAAASDSGHAVRPDASIRPYVVTSNGVSQRIRAHTVPAEWAAIPAWVDAAVPVKASINTANFATLAKAFWNAMCDAGTCPAVVVPPAADPVMFANVSRDVATVLPDTDVMQLRAAIAATNAIAMRSPGAPVMQTVALSGGRSADVYPIVPQPFITEVLTDVLADNTTRYLGVELFNGSGAAIDLAGWQVGYVNRTGFAFTSLYTFPATPMAPSTFLVLESANRPADVTAPAGTVITIATLNTAIPYELVLRPPGAVAPADQINLAGTLPAVGTPARYRYERNSVGWQAAWPGGYTPGTLLVPNPKPTDGLILANGATGSLGLVNMTPTVGVAPWAPGDLPLWDTAWAGLNKMAVPPFTTPFGGFARDGDMLRVMFIGSYRIYGAGGDVEQNSPTMDLYLSDTAGVGGANMGRFIPGAVPAYLWTTQLFDYVTAIDVPADDYMPNVDPTAVAPQVPLVVPNGPVLNPASANAPNESLAPAQGRININTVPWRLISALPVIPASIVDVNGNGIYDYLEARDALSKLIVTQRKTAPFATITGLNAVPHFQFAEFENPPLTWTPLLPANPTAAWGEYGTVNTGFERDNLMLSRISNMITTRSDSFTVYITVQAWRNAGTANATMDSAQRSAFLVDRSAVTPTNPNPRIVPIPVR